MSEALRKSSPRRNHRGGTAVQQGESSSLGALSQQFAEGPSFPLRRSARERYHCNLISPCTCNLPLKVVYLI